MNWTIRAAYSNVYGENAPQSFLLNCAMWGSGMTGRDDADHNLVIPYVRGNEQVSRRILN
jgi:hypothetical protein